MVTSAMKFDQELTDWAWQQLEGHFKDHKIKRQHITDFKKISKATYDKTRKGQYASTEGERWLRDLGHILDAVNEIIEAPPAELRSIVRPGGAVPWAALFRNRSDFPSRPGASEGTPYRPRMDGAAAEVGLGWRRMAVLPYEQQLLNERERYRGLGDASKLRQVVEKLVSLHEATGDWNAAVQLLRELRVINEDFKDQVFIADCCLRLGVAFYRLGRWPQASEVIAQGLAVVHRHQNILSGSKIELRLRGYEALTRLRTNNPTEALRLLDEFVAPLTRKHASPYVTATYHHRRALILLSLGRYDEAHTDFEEALTLRLDCTAHFEVTRTLFYFGQLCWRENKRAAALIIWTLCEQRHRRFEDNLGLARAALALGHAYARFDADHGRKGGELKLDLFDATLSGREFAAIERLAHSYFESAGDGLRIVLHSSELGDHAVHAFRTAAHIARHANDPKIVDEAEGQLEQLAALHAAQLS